MTPSDWPFPWPRPSGSAYADAGPPGPVEFAIGGHKFRVWPTTGRTLHTGRRLYGSECMTCGVVLHAGSTSGDAWIRRHLEAVTRPH